MLTLALLLLADPVAFDSITLADAQKWHGKTVTITFTSSKPPVTWKGHTTAGPADRPDGIERTVILKGKRLDIRDGETVTVTGKLPLIHHPPAQVGAVLVPTWLEIRVEEVGVRPWGR